VSESNIITAQREIPKNPPVKPSRPSSIKQTSVSETTVAIFDTLTAIDVSKFSSLAKSSMCQMEVMLQIYLYCYCLLYLAKIQIAVDQLLR